MKKEMTQKMSYLALGLLFLSSQLKAGEPVKVDYTDYLKNPSFEYYEDGTTFIDVTNTSGASINNGALRGTPPGWSDSDNLGRVVAPASISYGINRGALNKDGYNHVWYSPGASQLSANFSLYQNVTGLPAGQYLVSCRLYVTADRLSNQRLFASTSPTNIVSQYFGLESDYRAATTTNIVDGESYSFANWLIYSTTGDAEARLKPVSVVITVAEGDVLTVGVKTSKLKKDGTSPTSNIGFFKVDDFHITRLPESVDPNDYTSKITNPDFELKLVDGVPTQLKTHSFDRDTPYGWSDINNAGIQPVTGNLLYGVKGEANNSHGAKSCWAQKSPFPDNFALYQDITDLPSGKYRVSCSMFLETGMVTNQRLFANNNVAYYGSESDYTTNLTEGEVDTFAGLATSADDISNRMMKPLSVEVDVAAGETLRIGIKTSNMKGTGVAGTGKEGWFTVDNFHLTRVGDLATSRIIDTESSPFSVVPVKNGFVLNFPKAAPATVKVVSLSGQTVYSSQVNAASTAISLPQGLYILQVSTAGTNDVTKVVVK